VHRPKCGKIARRFHFPAFDQAQSLLPDSKRAAWSNSAGRDSSTCLTSEVMTTINRDHRRRWLQFSLRTFLVALTVFGVWLGFQVNRAHRQRRAVTALQEMGWLIFYDDYEETRADKSNPTDPWLYRTLGRDLFLNVSKVYPEFVLLGQHGEHVNLGFGHDVNPAIDQLARLTQITELSLDALEVSDDQVNRIRPLVNLRELGLSRTRISDEALAVLANFTELRRIDLSKTMVSDSGLKRLRVLTNLEYLNLEGTTVTASGIASLRVALPQCEIRGPSSFYPL